MLTTWEILDSLRGKRGLRKPTFEFWELYGRWKKTMAYAGVIIVRTGTGERVNVEYLTSSSLAWAHIQVQSERELDAPSPTANPEVFEPENSAASSQKPATSTQTKELTLIAQTASGRDVTKPRRQIPLTLRPLLALRPAPPAPVHPSARFYQHKNGSWLVAGDGSQPKRGQVFLIRTKAGSVRLVKIGAVEDCRWPGYGPRYPFEPDWLATFT